MKQKSELEMVINMPWLHWKSYFFNMLLLKYKKGKTILLAFYSTR